MTILVYDGKGEKGEELTGLLGELTPDDRVHLFNNPKEITDYADSHIYNVVFVCLYDEDDISLALALMHIIPEVNMILTAQDERYMKQALYMHASGYICMPLTEEALEAELSNLLYPPAPGCPVVRWDEKSGEVYIDGEPVHFAYSKTRDLFILLLSMKGAMVRTEKMRDHLFDEDKQDGKSRSYLQNLRSDLIHSLARYGLEDAVCRRRGRMWLDRNKYIEEKIDDEDSDH